MKSSYSFEENKGLLVMTITGNYDYWDFITYPARIRKECEARDIYKVLVDVVPVSYRELPTLELFFLGEEMAEVFRDSIKVALVWQGDNKDRFLQKVATNRAASLRIFPHLETAEVWLLYDREDEPMNLFR